ncbi:MAG: ABC transporter permease, partial [Bacteroidota bacterium]
MLRNYIKIAFRSLWKGKIFTGINIIGLTFGIAAVLLIYRLVNYELSFNKDFEHYDRIVRVVSDEFEGNNTDYTPGLPIPAMEILESTITQFEKTARIRETYNYITLANEAGGNPKKKFAPQNTALLVDPGFFEIFDFKALSGDLGTAVDQPNTIVLTKDWAEKFFGNWEEALGKTLLLDHIHPLKVTAVLDDLKSNVDFVFPYAISYKTLKGKEDYLFYGSDWGSISSNDQFYALLRDKDQLEDANRYVSKVGAEQYKNRTGEIERVHRVQPLAELHFDDRYGNSGNHTVSKNRLRVLAFIGLLILIMACFNFINLATAQATLRSKEVGVRKTLGGQRGQLVIQFMVETGITVLLAVIFGVLLAALSAPLLKRVSDVPDQWPFFSDLTIWGFISPLVVIVTILAGIYPALRLSSFKPIEALKSKVINRNFAGANVRKALVVLQFLIAQGLIIGIIITLLQLDYIRSKDLGFKADLVYTFGFNFDESTIARQGMLKEKLLQIPKVESVSFSSDQPLSGNTWTSNFRYGNRPEDEEFGVSMKWADADYPETYGIELVAGEWLRPSDTIEAVLINETLVKKLNIDDPQEVIGQIFTLGSSRRYPIKGVMKDFHTHSLHDQKLPLMISTRKQFYWSGGVKIQPGDIAATTAAIKSVYDEVLPEQVFEPEFLDADIAQMYEDDDRLSATCWGFGILAVLISCLGLFGLAAHAAAQRTKEIGIRKVLGASIPNLVGMLSKDFLLLVIIALIVASPIAWYLMQQWLNDFEYRIDIQWWIFAVAGMAAMLIAFLTVSF